MKRRIKKKGGDEAGKKELQKGEGEEKKRG